MPAGEHELFLAFLDNLLVTLIDPSPERRRAIGAFLAPLVKHVEQHGELTRATRLWPQIGMLAVADTKTLVAELQEAMRTKVTWRPHVVFGEVHTPAAITDAIAGGATDYLEWPCFEEVLIERSTSWPGRSATIATRERKVRRATALLAKLSKREGEVLELLAKGQTSAEIGLEFGITKKTVDVHRSSILRRLKVGSTVAAVRLLVEKAI